MIPFRNSARGLFLMLAALSVLAGCAAVTRTDFPTTASGQSSELPDYVRVIPITPENIRQVGPQSHQTHGNTQLPSARSSWQYNIGVGDVLSIVVYDHPELTLSTGLQSGAPGGGSIVNENGSIFYPYLGQVRVAGRLVVDVQRELTNRLVEFIPDPQIEVQIAAYNARKVVVTGAVNAAISLPVTNIPLTLIEAINAAGGLAETADSQHVTIRRANTTYNVNLRSFLENGDARNNPVLRGGDTVNVPRAAPRRAFMLGKILEPGIVDLEDSGTSLTEAITLKGGLDEANANASGIFVFRNTTDGIDVFQLDASSPIAFVLATKFTLLPDDVVYVVTDPAARWNEIIAQIFPTISALRQAQLIGRDS